MYKVYCDNYLIHDDNLESLEIFNPKVSVELNAVGSFTFTIYPEHPYFDKLLKMKSIVTVYQNGYLLFRGRILNDVNGFHNEKHVTCESELAFLLDSVQRPYDFQGTPAQLFTQLIQNHNSQVDADHQFNVGNITVTDPNNYIHRSDSTYLDTWKSVNEKLIDGLGGYLWVRHESDGNYIDYLADFNTLSSQKIEFGKNLLEMKRTIKADDIFTVIVPLGASIKDDQGNDLGRLTIADVNDGKDYLENAEGIQTYGRIVKKVEWNNVTVASNLKNKGQALLDSSVMLTNTIELTAADLGAIDEDVTSFHLGTKVHIISEPHNINSMLLVKKLSVDLLNPSNNKIQLGTTFYSMTESQQNQLKQSITQVNESIQNVKVDVVETTSQQMSSSIQTTSQAIVSSVSETYYTKNQINEIIEEQSTEMQQMSNGWEQTFRTFKQSYDADKEGTDAQFDLIEKYIRYIDGKIILGEVGNQLELRIANNELGFYQNNTKVAYFSNNKMYVTDGEFTNSLQLGKFSFLPRTNGNLSFKKVRD